MTDATTDQNNQNQASSVGKFAARIGGMLASLPQKAAHHFSAIGFGLTAMANELNSQQARQADKPLNPDEVKAWSADLRRQLDHLRALAGLQQAHLHEKRPHDPLALDVSIYAFSGMREQIGANIEAFERMLMTASNPGIPAPSRTSGPLAEPHQPHEATKVSHTAPKRGLFGGTPRTVNDTICDQLVASYAEFVKTTQQVSESFRLAAATSLLELSAPIDELRALMVWMHNQEGLYYQRQPA